MRVRPGDILYVNRGRLVGRVAVLTSSRRKGGMKLQVLTPSGISVQLTARDFSDVPRVLGRIELPTPFAPNRAQYQRQVARLLSRATVAGGTHRQSRPLEHGDDGSIDHPVAQDPMLRERLRAAGQAERTAREVDDLRQRIQGRSQSVSHRFDRVLRILEAWGYVDGWELTDAGRRLAGFFHECDLLVVEAVRQGHLDGLDPAALAGLASVFSYEHRSPDAPPAPWFPSRDARKRWEAIESLAAELRYAEEEAGLPVTRAPDPTFVALAHAWAAGQSFASVVEDEDLSGGDFVRTMKQLIDLLRQLALLAPVEETRAAAREAADRLFRGVVAASTAIDVDDGRRRQRPEGPPGRDGSSGARTGAAARPTGRRGRGGRRRRRRGPRRRGPAGRSSRPPCSGSCGGDLRRTLGGGAPVDHLADEVGEYPVDVGLVVLDGVERAFLAHLVARRSWWRGEVVAAMNAEHLGSWDVAPRGHPNDGRLDVLHVVDLGLGDRWKAWRRLPTGTHVPHPAIALRPAAAVDLALRRPLTVWLDGRRAGTTDHLVIRVEPDALTVCI